MELTPELVLASFNNGKKPLPFLSSDTSMREAYFFSCSNSLVKKWRPDSTASLDEKAISLFFEMNERCDSWEADTNSYYHDTLNDMKERIIRGFMAGELGSCVLNLDQCHWYGRAGPGASIGTRHSDFYRKMFCSDLSTSDESLYDHYRSRLSERWLQAELLRLRRHTNRVVEGSKLGTVPKDYRISRTICTEPSLNMYYQLGAGRVIERMLWREFRISLSEQPQINAEFARVGSIDGSYATIDLKSASDSISSKLVKYLLPSDAYRCLDFIRSKRVLEGDRLHELKMFSSMGNGFTFPLQTYIFASLVATVYKELKLPLFKNGKLQFGVFGDDIVCDKHAYYKVCRMLEYCGFIVNVDKSYATGNFRESCGSDFFKGHNIRGVYLKGVKDVLDRYSAVNRLLRWSIRTNTDTSGVLRLLLAGVKFRPVPFDESDTSGVKVPYAMLRVVKRDRNGCVFYHAIEPVRRSLSVGDSCENPFGAFVSALGGYVTAQRVTLRTNNSSRRKVQVVKRKTPLWDYLLGPAETRDYCLALERVLDDGRGSLVS